MQQASLFEIVILACLNSCKGQTSLGWVDCSTDFAIPEYAEAWGLSVGGAAQVWEDILIPFPKMASHL